MRSCAFLLVLAVSAAFAQLDTPRRSTRGYVTTEPAPEVTVQPGKGATVELRFRVNAGYHINSHHPGSELLIPTTIEFASLEKIKTGNIVYPAGEQFASQFSPKDKLSVYSGDMDAKVPIAAAKDAVPGRYSLKGELHYQACNDSSCFPPKSLPLQITVVVKR